MLYVIQRTVKVEGDFRNNAELLSYLVSKFTAQCPAIFLESVHDSFCLLRRKDAYVYLCYRKVRTDLYSAYGYKGTSKGGHTFTADDFSHLLLDFLRNLQLPCAFDILFHLLYNLDDEVVLLSLLCKDVLAVDERLFSDLCIDVCNLLLVDAYTICLNHLAALAL